MQKLFMGILVLLGLSLSIHEVHAQENEPNAEQSTVILVGASDLTVTAQLDPRFKKHPGIKKRPFKGGSSGGTSSGGPSPADTGPTGTTSSSQCVVKTSDIAMNPLIDIGYEDSRKSSLQNPNDSSAQQSLMRIMSKGSVAQRCAASGQRQM